MILKYFEVINCIRILLCKSYLIFNRIHSSIKTIHNIILHCSLTFIWCKYINTKYLFLKGTIQVSQNMLTANFSYPIFHCYTITIVCLWLDLTTIFLEHNLNTHVETTCTYTAPEVVKKHVRAYFNNKKCPYSFQIANMLSLSPESTTHNF